MDTDYKTASSTNYILVQAYIHTNNIWIRIIMYDKKSQVKKKIHAKKKLKTLKGYLSSRDQYPNYW